MSNERERSADSFDQFFNAANKENELKPSAGIAALIKSQPVVHHRRATPPERLPSISPKAKPSTVPKQKMQRKRERFLPYIRSKVTIKRKRSQVEDRIHSAQQQKFNELQSRLNELRRQLEKEQEENRTLKIIQKREEQTLKKYEDQEYDVHRVARDFTKEIHDVKVQLDEQREIKEQLQVQFEEREEKFLEQRKKLRHFEKLINDVDLDNAEELESKYQRLTNKLKQIEDKIHSKEKLIDKLERDNRNEMQDELIKQRDLKRELDQQAKDYRDLMMKFEEKNRQVGTMHIYIQRGGRRPSHTSVTLTKSRSLQSLEPSSPRLREKMLEYDRQRREQAKLLPKLRLKPKPKPKPLPEIPKARTPPPPLPPPIVKKKFVPDVEQHPLMIKPRTFDSSPLFLEEKGSLRHRASPKSIEEEKSNVDDDTTYQSTMAPSPTPSPTLPGIQHPDQMSQARIHRRPSSPLIPPLTAPSHLKKPTPLPPVGKTTVTKDDSHTDKWFDLLELDSTKTTAKDDLLSKLISHEPQEKKVVLDNPPAPRANLIMFEPSTIVSNGKTPKKPWAPLPPVTATTTTTSNSHDFDQAVNNLHDGKPVDAPRSDPFDSIFTSSSSNKNSRTRDDTFTVTETKIEPFESVRAKPMANRSYVEEIEEFSL